MRRGLWWALLSVACAEAPRAPMPRSTPADEPRATVSAEARASASAAPTAPPPPSADVERAPCEQVAHAPIGGLKISVCIDRDVSDDDTFVSTRVEDERGRVLLGEHHVMSFSQRRAAGPKVSFGDVTGDGVDDVLIAAPAPDSTHPDPCKYVVDGAELLRAPLPDGEPTPLSLAFSFAASLARGKDQWRNVGDASAPIAPKQACEIITASRTLAGFLKHATPDVEIVDYYEPGRPNCSVPLKNRGVAADRVTELATDACGSLTCDKKLAFCRDHEPDPSARFYFFVRDKAGRPKLRGVALYRGS